MNLFQLVFKQMRQRALATWLTLLSVLLGVGLATAVLLVQREGAKLFGQTDFGYDMIIGPKGNKLQLVLSTAYHLGAPAGTTIPYSYYESFPELGSLEWIAPCLVGDNYKGYRIVATLPKMFRAFPREQDRAIRLVLDQQKLVGKPLTAEQRAVRDAAARLCSQTQVDAPDAFSRLNDAIAAMDEILAVAPQPRPTTPLRDLQDSALESLRATAVLLGGPVEYRRGRAFELAEGRIFDPRKFEAVVGADAAIRGGLRIGSTFQAAHGAEQSSRAEQHDESWKVVGVLKPTHTANDRAIFIPLVSGYAVPAHEAALRDLAGLDKQPESRPAAVHHDDHDHEAYTLNSDGTINLSVPKNEWRVAAILARTKGSLNESVRWAVDNGNVAMAVTPTDEMRAFYDTFLKASADLLLLVSLLVSIVASISILVSIYNSVSARRRDTAVLRALGATRNRVLAIICTEAGLIGAIGGLGGLILGHLLGAGVSLYLQRLMGEGINWLTIDHWEALYLVIVIVLSIVAGLVPAAKAYRTPVATNLVAT